MLDWGGSKADRVKMDLSVGPLLCAIWMFSPNLVTAFLTQCVTSSEMYGLEAEYFIPVGLLLSLVLFSDGILLSCIGGVIILQHLWNLLNTLAASCCCAGDLQSSVHLRKGYCFFGWPRMDWAVVIQYSTVGWFDIELCCVGGVLYMFIFTYSLKWLHKHIHVQSANLYDENTQQISGKTAKPVQIVVVLR